MTHGKTSFTHSRGTQGSEILIYVAKRKEAQTFR